MTYALLSRRLTLGVVAALVALAGAAWIATVDQALSMRNMVMGLAEVGSGISAGTAAPIFLGMWVLMMVAMMFPAVAPIVLAHRAVVLRRGEGPAPTVAFVVGYLMVWAAAGLPALAALLAMREISAEAAGDRWLPMLAGGALAVAGAYQFTHWKSTCLRACRTPISFVLTHDWGSGARGALRAGLSHGGFCLGCCWALMAVLLVVGLMNLVWMAGLTLIFMIEKHWQGGDSFTRAVGSSLVALGVAIMIHPSLLAGIA